jgi:hypothetical protein
MPESEANSRRLGIHVPRCLFSESSSWKPLLKSLRVGGWPCLHSPGRRQTQASTTWIGLHLKVGLAGLPKVQGSTICTAGLASGFNGPCVRGDHALPSDWHGSPGNQATRILRGYRRLP